MIEAKVTWKDFHVAMVAAGGIGHAEDPRDYRPRRRSGPDNIQGRGELGCSPTSTPEGSRRNYRVDNLLPKRVTIAQKLRRRHARGAISVHTDWN